MEDLIFESIVLILSILFCCQVCSIDINTVSFKLKQLSKIYYILFQKYSPAQHQEDQSESNKKVPQLKKPVDGHYKKTTNLDRKEELKMKQMKAYARGKPPAHLIQQIFPHLDGRTYTFTFAF